MAPVTEKCAEATVPNNTVNSVDNNDNIDSNGNNRGLEPKSEFKEFNVQKLTDMFTKLSPLAKEFVPSSCRNQIKKNHFLVKTFAVVKHPGNDNANFNANPRRGNYNQGRRLNGRAFRAQKEDSIRRTVYVSDIDQTITEERLAGLFSRAEN